MLHPKYPILNLPLVSILSFSAKSLLAPLLRASGFLCCQLSFFILVLVRVTQTRIYRLIRITSIQRDSVLPFALGHMHCFFRLRDQIREL